MKTYLTLGLLSSLLLTSCSVDWNDQNSIFKKNKECSELKNTDGAYQKFYSPKENTCIVYFIKWNEHIIKNAFTNEIIISISSNEQNTDNLNKFSEKLKELK